MGWELVKPWVNRVGIVLEFLSFWLAAPEILGEERLRKLERRVERVLDDIPHTLASELAKYVSVGILALVLFLFGVTTTSEFNTVMPLTIAIGLAVAVIVAAVRVFLGKKISRRGRWELATMLVFAFLLMAKLAVEVMATRPGWLEVGKALLAALAFIIAVMAANRVFEAGLKKAVAPLLRVMADDKRIRQRSLAVGAVLFVVGFVLQLIATF